MEYVYFISQPSSGRIKIGTTRNLNTRLAGLISSLADHVTLLGNIEGGRHLERAIHKSLSKYRIRGEWFKDCSAVRNAIDDLLSDGPEVAIDYVRPQKEPTQFDKKKTHANGFGVIARALWPTKTALNLAQRIGSTERGAQYLIDGERKVTARAIAVIIAEILD